MKKITTYYIAISLVFSLFSLKSTAQAILYNETFDANGQLPSGWSTTGGWSIDSSGTNASTAAYLGASGVNNCVISNATGVNGDFELVTRNISTVNFKTIYVIWGARNTKHFPDSGSSISGFYWSSDNGNNWNSLSLSVNYSSTASPWLLENNSIPIALPQAAENQATLKFKLVANLVSNSQGTYRIDDFSVGGTVATGIQSPTAQKNNSLANVYVANHNMINIVANDNQKLNVEVCDVLGKRVKSAVMNSSSFNLNASDLSAGIYFVRVSSPVADVVNKVVLK